MTAKKRFGQHFLRDEQVIQRLIQTISPRSTDRLVEIGPGRGALTFALLKCVGKLTALEIDRDLILTLQRQAAHYGDLQLLNCDALNCDLRALAGGLNEVNDKLRIVGNLPYNISTPLLFHLLEQLPFISDMHFMLQKEVVNRLAASPNNKNYGRLSIMVQLKCRVDALFDVPPTAFSPMPKVDSAVVRLTPLATSLFPTTHSVQFAKLVEIAFNQRRKTLRNALGTLASPAAFEQAQIDANARPETLSPSQFVALSQSIFSTQEPS